MPEGLDLSFLEVGFRFCFPYSLSSPYEYPFLKVSISSPSSSASSSSSPLPGEEGDTLPPCLFSIQLPSAPNPGCDDSASLLYPSPPPIYMSSLSFLFPLPAALKSFSVSVLGMAGRFFRVLLLGVRGFRVPAIGLQSGEGRARQRQK